MVEEAIPETIRQFIFEKIDSIEQLQVLFLLNKDPMRAWTVQEITAELRSSEASISKRLRGLYDRGVLKKYSKDSQRHRFEPTSDRYKIAIDDLVGLYQTKPYLIIDLIYSRAGDALRAFSDSFKLKKDES